jgi:hypothetical protein
MRFSEHSRSRLRQLAPRCWSSRSRRPAPPVSCKWTLQEDTHMPQTTTGHGPTHRHGQGCGHTAIDHAGHVDYLEDGHLHHRPRAGRRWSTASPSTRPTPTGVRPTTDAITTGRSMPTVPAVDIRPLRTATIRTTSPAITSITRTATTATTTDPSPLCEGGAEPREHRPGPGDPTSIARVDSRAALVQKSARPDPAY